MLRAVLLILALPFFPAPVFAAPITEVVVLSTLHQLHADVRGYDFDALRDAVVSLSPDVICMEVDPTDLDARRDEGVKVEYPRVVYPLLDENNYDTCVLEPAPEAASKIIAPYAAANARFMDTKPEAAAAFETYSDAMYALLKTYWQSPADVNDAITDRILAAKHGMQSELIGDDEAAGWEAWNTHFLARILDAVKAHPGKRIVVLVGLEHGYWLRDALKTQETVHLLDTSSLLREEKAD